MRRAKVFVGSSHPELGKQICESLLVPPAPCTLSKFANGETSVAIGVSVRQEDCYIVQSGSPNVNDSIMEMLILISACKGGSANKVTAVLPYFPYSKQSKMKKHRGAITAKMIAKLLVMAGADHVITMDLHATQMQGFFSKPVDNLYGGPALARWVKLNVIGWKEAVVVSKNPGGAKRVTSLADALKIDFALIHTDRARISFASGRKFPASSIENIEHDIETAAKKLENEISSGLASPPIRPFSDCHTARLVEGHVLAEDEEEEEEEDDEEFDDRDEDPMAASMLSTSSRLDHALGGSVDAVESDDEDEVESHEQHQPVEKTITLVGDVEGRTVLIIDDIIDKPKSFIAAAEHCRKNCGAQSAIVMATHGIFGDGSLEAMEECPYIDKIVVTNSLPISPEKKLKSTKLHIINISSILAECIRRNHYGESISCLFENLSID